MDLSKAIIILFVVLFAAIAILTIASLPGWVKIDDKFRNKLFAVLILQVVGVTMSLVTLAVKHYYSNNMPPISHLVLTDDGWGWHWAEGGWYTDGKFTEYPDHTFSFQGKTTVYKKNADGVHTDERLARIWDSGTKHFAIPEDSTSFEFECTMTVLADSSVNPPAPESKQTIKIHLKSGVALLGKWEPDGGGMVFTPFSGAYQQ